MNSLKKPKLLENNIHFFVNNLISLLKLRPQISFELNEHEIDKNVEITASDNSYDIDSFYQIQNEIKALNSAIILNCFSLFEATFEWKLLTVSELNTKGLTGIQERVMQKYINDVIKISSIDNYIKEFKFITGKSIKEYLSENDYKNFLLVKDFYVVRHLLTHGSVSKNVMEPKDYGGTIELDTEDKEYQIFLSSLKKRLKINVSNAKLRLEHLLLINGVTDLLLLSVFGLTKSFNLTKKAIFVKENIFNIKKNDNR